MSPVLAAPVGVVAFMLVLRAATSASDRRRLLRRLPVSGPGAVRSRPWLRAPSWFAAPLAEADLSIDPDRALQWWITGVALAGLLGGTVGGPAAAGVTASAALIVPAALVRSRPERFAERLNQALPGGLESMARSLRSGAGLHQALGEAAAEADGPLRLELSRVVADVERGTSLTSAIEALAGRRPNPGVELFAAAVSLGQETGGAQARMLDTLAGSLRDRMALAQEIRALSSQARISALVIGMAPLAFTIFSAVTDSHSGQFLLGTGGGRALLALGLALELAGWLWMRRLCRLGP